MTVLRQYNTHTATWDIILAGSQGPAGAPGGPVGPVGPAGPAGGPAPGVYDIRTYGAKVDGRVRVNCDMTAGSPVLTSTGFTFVAGDVGKAVGVLGAGFFSPDYSTNANDGVLISTIVSISGSTATLANNAVTTVTGGTAVWGTPDDAAISAAQDAAVAAGGGQVYFPPGRTVVTQPLGVKDYVSWAGAHRDLSWVEVIISGPGTGPGGTECSWLHCGTQSKSNPLTGASFHDFGVNARCAIRPGGYTNPMKPLNIYYVNRCDIYRMNVWNTPTTAIPFDMAYEWSLIAYNYILNPGRMYSQNSNPGKSGCSGIGIGTRNDGSEEPGLVIGNTIIGNGSPTTMPSGHNGIFVEGQGGSDPFQGSRGYRIVNNYIRGMSFGITDAGSQGTMIANNIVNQCVVGIRVVDTPIGGAFPGLDTTVIGNTILDSVAWNTGPTIGAPADDNHGLGMNISSAGGTTGIRTRVMNNTIIKCAGRGIRVYSGGVPIDNLVISGNKIRDTQRSGIHVLGVGTTPGSTALTDLVIENNDIATYGLGGLLATGGQPDQAGIYLGTPLIRPSIVGNRVVGASNGLVVSGGCYMTDNGRIINNTFPDVTVNGGIAATIRKFGNLGWPAAVPVVSGYHGNNQALISLITGLSDLGVVINNTSSVNDTSPPTVPGSVVASRLGAVIRLTWVASTDNIGVTAYDIHRWDTSGFTVSAATLRTTVSGSTLQWDDPGSPSTAAYYRVVARDNAGNSTPSVEAAATSLTNLDLLVTGSMVLWDPSDPAEPWSGLTSPTVNRANALCAAQIGGTAGLTFVNNLTAPEGLVQRSTKGGLHIMISQTGAAINNHLCSINRSASMDTYWKNNSTHDLYLSAAFRMTRGAPDGTTGWSAYIGKVSWTTTTNFYNGVGIYPTTGIGRAITANNLGTDMDISPTGEYFVANTVSQGDAAIATNGTVSAVFYNGVTDPTRVSVTPSFLLYRLYIEDLQVSGRTHAQVYAIDHAIYVKEVLTPGGRYYGDTWSDPATVMP